ncbi:copper chaperone PCu(A)C [Altererythrobacter sp. MTPC7]|uniref:copper chaperone PCu(A)C n=1 Tax=Altererythrobacter sp. MTPC7 TaxID=3056567 RepID=UPI0036F37387
MKKWALALALGVAGTAISSCGETAEAPAGDVEAVPGLTVENARLVLPPVSGNPAAIYMDVRYSGERSTTLRAVSVEKSENAELHETSEWNGGMVMGEMGPLLLNDGDEVSFEPGGRHIMVFGLEDDVAEGQSLEVTLTVVGGDKTSFEAEVVAAGADR